MFGHDAERGFDCHRVWAADVEPHIVHKVVSQSAVERHVRFVLIVEKLIRRNPWRNRNDGVLSKLPIQLKWQMITFSTFLLDYFKSFLSFSPKHIFSHTGGGLVSLFYILQP